MKRHTANVIQHVIELRRKQRYSYEELRRLTGIPATTIRIWCTGVVIGTKRDTLLITNEKKRKQLRLSETNVVNRFSHLTLDAAKLLTALLYWCEGSKYPSSCAVTMVNSDSEVLRVFVTLLRRSFVLDESKFSVHMQIHDTHDFSKIRSYWSNVFNIPIDHFIKPTVTHPKGKKHRNGYLGTCTVKYQDYRIQLKLIDIYEAFAQRFGRVA